MQPIGLNSDELILAKRTGKRFYYVVMKDRNGEKIIKSRDVVRLIIPALQDKTTQGLQVTTTTLALDRHQPRKPI